MWKQRPRLTLAVPMLAAVLVSGCDQTMGSSNMPVASVPAQPERAPVNPGLPEGAPCTAAYVRYQTVLKADVDTGNVEQPVYDQIQKELTRALSACSDGRDSEALSVIKASEAKHGYHT